MLPEILDVLEGRKQWCVIHGDNAKVLPGLPDKSVAHVITDPPYEAEAHSKGRRIITGAKGASVYGEGRLCEERPLDFEPMTEGDRELVSSQIARIATRWILVFCQVEATVKWAAALTGFGATYRRTCVWLKVRAQPQMSGDRPGMGYETFVACHAKGRSKWNGGGRWGIFEHDAQADARVGHMTQKPLALMLELVELFTDPSDLVVDPYVGSGTTGVACLRLGRRFIGIEKDEKYAAIARERLEAESKGLTLRDARAGQLSLLEAAK